MSDLLCICSDEPYVESHPNICRRCSKIVFLSKRVFEKARSEGLTVLYSCLGCADADGIEKTDIDPVIQQEGLDEFVEFIAQVNRPPERA